MNSPMGASSRPSCNARAGPITGRLLSDSSKIQPHCVGLGFCSRSDPSVLWACPHARERLMAHKIARRDARLMLWLLPTPNTSLPWGSFRWM